MRRILLKSKIHAATVTAADLEYEGSVTIDQALLDAVDIVPFEQVDIYDVTNGERLTTYAIAGEAGSGDVCINGAAAHLVRPGHRIIIAAYAEFEEPSCRDHQPKIIVVDGSNRPVQLDPVAGQ